MAMRLRVIDGFDRGELFPLVESGSMTVGNSRKEADIVLHELYVSRAHCRLEIDGERVTVVNGVNASGTLVNGKKIDRQQLRPGDVLRVGNSHLRLEVVGADDEDGPGDTGPDAGAAPGGLGGGPVRVIPQGRRVRRLKVIDGTDHGHVFPLLEAGSMSIGSNRRSADIVLRDLHVSRVHCQLEIEGDRVTVVGEQGPYPTLVNGRRVTRQELRPGDVLLVGKTALRLEVVAGEGPDPTPEEIGVIPLAHDDEGPPPESAEASGGTPAPQPSPPADRMAQLEGQTLSHYKIGRLLGRGHCGVVFRARDSRSGQAVALKVLLPEFPRTPAEFQHFVEALKSTQPLQHPNLVPLSGVGKSGPYSWLARPYVEGDSVAGVIRRLGATGRIDWTHACRVAVHVGRALEFLRRHHVTHGNITPQNLLVRAADQRTLLTDLMLMKALEGSELQQATLENKLLAELPYMAPEQVDPNAFVDEQADLYGLGAVVYALLTGRPPFSAPSPEELIQQIQQQAPARPSKYQRNIPSALEEVVLRLLGKRQEDRYPSPAELLAELEPIAAQQGLLF